MKILLGIIVVVLLGAGAWLYFGGVATPAGNTIGQAENATPSTSAESEKVSPGTYKINAERSVVNWAGKKPLIEGYINSGTIDITEGTITATENSATGSFTLDMDTLKVGLTPTKPGQESTLEGHLKSDRFFDVATYPTAVFDIKSVAPTATSDTDFRYTLTGDLTMKGETHEVSFPAVVYEANDTLYANATTEIDRTKWGITASSGNFFEDLGDNMIDDMVGLSISLEADKVQ